MKLLVTDNSNGVCVGVKVRVKGYIPGVGAVTRVLTLEEAAWVEEEEPDLMLEPEREDSSDAEESARRARGAARVLEVAIDCLKGSEGGPPDTRDGGSLPESRLVVSRDSSSLPGARKSQAAYTYRVREARPPGGTGSWA